MIVLIAADNQSEVCQLKMNILNFSSRTLKVSYSSFSCSVVDEHSLMSFGVEGRKMKIIDDLGERKRTT